MIYKRVWTDAREHPSKQLACSERHAISWLLHSAKLSVSSAAMMDVCTPPTKRCWRFVFPRRVWRNMDRFSTFKTGLFKLGYSPLEVVDFKYRRICLDNLTLVYQRPNIMSCFCKYLLTV